MHRILTFTLALFPFLLTAQPQDSLPVIRSGSRFVDIRIGDELMRQAWRIVPEASPDVLTAPCRIADMPVAFYTDTDTIQYAVNPGDSHQFYILLNDTAYALTEVRGVPYIKAANYTPEYIETHKDKWTVEVPEVQELVHIVFALTATGVADSNLVEHERPYYQEVMAHFAPYRGEPVVGKIDELLQKGLYADLKMNSCAFTFEGDRIVNGGIYDRLGWFDENSITPFLPELEAFARKSGFRAFYAAHQPLYDSLIERTVRYMPIDKQWQWCEERFDNRYDSYRITFSPLVNGSHSTNRFSDNGFAETVMFICPAFHLPRFRELVNEGLNTRIVFTEIDHNYVNPVSDKYIDGIDKAMSNRSLWADGPHTSGYDSPYAVFNEYMTWGVFTLYCYDNYEPKDFEEINYWTERLIAKGRGFLRFPEFNAKLLELYKQAPDKKIEEFYPAMLAWCKEVNAEPISPDNFSGH